MGGGSNGLKFGVVFTDAVTGTRLGDATQLSFSPSTTTIAGVDDFISISPFNIRECLTVYNSTTKKQEVVAYEGTSKFEELKDNTDYNYFIQFPAFYYKRNGLEWWISDYPHEGYLPSPTHYRDGKMYKYVYISKYFLDANLKSRFANRDSYNINEYYHIDNGGSSLDKTKPRLKDNGMYAMDYACICAINMLIFVKYCMMNTRSILGGGIHNTGLNNIEPKILGKDGHSWEIDTKGNGGMITCMGLQGYIGDSPTVFDGIKVGDGMKFYVNTSLESENFEFTGYIQRSGWSAMNNIADSSTHPWVMYPATEGIPLDSNGTQYWVTGEGNNTRMSFGCWDISSQWTVFTLCDYDGSYPWAIRGVFYE